MPVKMINTWWSTLVDVDQSNIEKHTEWVCSKVFIRGFGSDEEWPSEYEVTLLKDFLGSIVLAKDAYKKAHTSTMIGQWKFVAFLEVVTNEKQVWTNQFLPMLGFKKSETFNNGKKESKDVWCWLVSRQEFDEKLEALLKEHA